MHVLFLSLKQMINNLRISIHYLQQDLRKEYPDNKELLEILDLMCNFLKQNKDGKIQKETSGN